MKRILYILLFIVSISNADMVYSQTQEQDEALNASRKVDNCTRDDPICCPQYITCKVDGDISSCAYPSSDKMKPLNKYFHGNTLEFMGPIEKGNYYLQLVLAPLNDPEMAGFCQFTKVRSDNSLMVIRQGFGFSDGTPVVLKPRLEQSSPSSKNWTMRGGPTGSDGWGVCQVQNPMVEIPQHPDAGKCLMKNYSTKK